MELYLGKIPCLIMKIACGKNTRPRGFANTQTHRPLLIRTTLRRRLTWESKLEHLWGKNLKLVTVKAVAMTGLR